jgi:hypothetical protein
MLKVAYCWYLLFPCLVHADQSLSLSTPSDTCSTIYSAFDVPSSLMLLSLMKKNLVYVKNNEIANKEVRVSKRQKRNPVNRKKRFFLWVMD